MSDFVKPHIKQEYEAETSEMQSENSQNSSILLTQVHNPKPQDNVTFRNAKYGDTSVDPNCGSDIVKTSIKQETIAGDKQYKCKNCPEQFEKASVLLQHLKTHKTDHKKSSITLKMTKIEIEISPSVPSDNDANIETEVTNGCYREISIKQECHREFVSHDISYTCNICAEQFNTASLLLRHTKNHNVMTKPDVHIYVPEVYYCDLCEYSTGLKEMLLKHIYARHTEHECKLCDYKTNTPKSLRVHMNCRHSEGKFFACHMCSYKCTKPAYLEQHLMKHTDNGEKSYSCNLCEYKTTKRRAYRTHIIRHTGHKPYECHVCGHRTTTSSNLKRHIMSHTGEKIYECKVCENLRYADLCSLKKHMNKKHSDNVKLYECSLCDLKYLDASSLKKHVNKKHCEVPKVYPCSMCDKVYTEPFILKTHISKKHSNT